MKISATKNVPRLVARSRRDKNLGGQKRAEISTVISAEISVRSQKIFHKGADQPVISPRGESHFVYNEHFACLKNCFVTGNVHNAAFMKLQNF